MDKKWIAVIVIIILLVAGLIAFYSFSNQSNKVKVGSATFKTPDGYHVEDSKDKNVTNLTKGNKNIYIKEYNDKNVKKYINSYVSQSKKNNKTVKISNFTVGKTTVYKSNLDNSSAVHYWFVKKNKTYTIYSRDKNPEIDSITIKLIESVRWLSRVSN